MSQDWSVVGRSGDPAPGDPVGVHRLGDRMVHNADLVDRNVTRLRGVAAGGGDLGLEGDFAPQYLQALGELPGELEKLGRAYRACGDALRGYAAELESAKARAQQAYGSGSDAHWHVQSAVRQIRTQAPAEAQNLQYARVFMDHGQSEQLLGNITDAAVQSSVRQSVLRARTAEADRRRAAALADQAASLHADAAERAGRRIDDALNGSGIKNLSWWEKAWNFVSAPFRSWDAFIELVQVIAIVVTVLAIIIGGPILGAILLVVGAILLINAIYQYTQGRATLWDVGLAVVSMIPGGRALAALGRFARGSGAATRVFGPLSRAAGRVTGPIRNALSNSRLFSRGPIARFFGRDPVDMASGEMFLAQTDATLPAAALPLIVRRSHSTNYRLGRLFGPAWSSPLDQRLELDITGVYYSAADGVLQRFPQPDSDAPVFADAGDRVELRALHDGTYTVTDPRTGHILHFGEVPGAPMGMFNLVRIVDRNGNAVEFEYADAAVLRAIRHYGGYVVDVVTDDGLVTAFRLRGGSGQPDLDLVRYAYNPAGMLTDIINSSGRPLTFGYDEHGRVVSWTDRNGAWYRYTYDGTGRCVSTQGSDGILNGTITYDGRSTVETNSLGHATTYHFNEGYQVERVVDPLGHARTLSWDEFNRLLSDTDALGNATSYSYDDVGNLLVAQRPDGTRTAFTYNDLNLPVTVVGPDGATTRREYDERGNLVALQDADRNRTTRTVDERGHLRSIVDVTGATIHVRTNPAGLPVALTDPLGATTEFAIDARGLVESVTDPLGGTTQLSWTTEGRLAARTAPDGATDRWIYDAEGNLTDYVNAVGAITRFGITGFDQVGVRTNPDGSRVGFSYDREMRLIAVTNAQGLIWRYERDAAGRVVRETDFNGRTITYSYDAVGQPVTRVNGAGQSVQFRYDPVGRVVESLADGAVTAFRYDPAGRLVAASSPDADLRYEYDVLGHVVAETCNGRSVRSEYDALGRRTARTTPSGARTEWVYDVNGLPVVMRTGGHEVHFGHDPMAREVSRTIGAVTLARTWDPNSRLAALTVTGSASQLLQHRAVTYRPDGAVTAIHDHLAGTREYDLDARGRVAAVRGEDWSEHYTYDVAGNITQATWPAPADSDAADSTGSREYAGTRVAAVGRVRYEHDAQGRVTLRRWPAPSGPPRDWRYTWDAQDRLVAVTTPDGTQWTYQYDALGRRVGKTRLGADGGVAERVEFTWDGARLAEQSDPDRLTTWDHEPGSLRPVAQTERRAGAGQESFDSRFYAIVTDLIGSPAELLDTDGVLAWRQRSTLWGDAAVTSTQRADCSLRFPGQYQDDETGLRYNLLRYYDPVAGHYLSNDPIGLAGGDSPHQYVPNPITWMDPFGLSPGCVNRAGEVAWGAFNNMVAQAINDVAYTGSMDPMNLVWAGVGGGIGGPFGGRSEPLGGAVTSFFTNGLIQLTSGDGFSFTQLGVATGLGGFFGQVSEDVGVIGVPGYPDITKTQLAYGASVFAGIFDFSGLVQGLP